MRKIPFFLILFFLFSTLGLKAQFSLDQYAIHHLNIVDVEQKKILKNYTIVINKDTIQRILPTRDFKSNDEIQSIEAKDKYVVPGLIDAHVHFATDPSKERRDHAESVLNAMLLTGITSVRDMAGDARALSSLSRDALVGDIDAPNIYYSALMAGVDFFTDPRTIATAQGGISGKMAYMKAIDSNSNIALDVAEAKGSGAKGIKLYADLSEEEINKIVREAKKQDMEVWSHAALNPAKPSEVIGSGVISISHVHMLIYELQSSYKQLLRLWRQQEIDEIEDGYWDKEFEKLDFSNVYALMKKNNVVLDATLTVLERYKSNPDELWRYEIGKRIAKQAYEAGVPIATGSDSDQKSFVQYEMKLLVNECGFSPMDAIVAATKHAAQATNIIHHEGSIEIGKKANLLFLNADPTEDIDQIDQVFLVIKNGKLYSPN